MRAKLARAQEHLDALKDGIASFMERKPYVVSYERKPDGSEHVFRVHVRETPPLSLPVLVGDCLQNARAALDHLVWQLAILAGKSQPPHRQTAFPVCETKADWLTKGTRDKVKDLTKEQRAAVERLQPFKVGAATKDHWLWHLNELSRVDRHRILHVVGGVLGEPTFSTHKVGETDDPLSYPIGQLGQVAAIGMHFSYATFEDGAQIARFTVDPPHPEVEMKGEFNMTVAFGKGARPGGPFPVTYVLGAILEHIEAEVVPPLAQFFEQP